MKSTNYLKELLSIQSKLLKYRPKIPAMQISKYERDMRDLFDNLNNYNNNELELEQAFKLAKAKLSSMKRVYGDIEQLNQNSKEDNSHLLDKEAQEKIKIDFEISEEEDVKFVSKLDEIKNMPGFNPDIVRKFHKEIDDENKMIDEALRIVLEEKANKEGKKDYEIKEKVVFAQDGEPLKVTKISDTAEEPPEDAEDIVKRVLKIKGVKDADKIAAEAAHGLKEMMEPGKKKPKVAFVTPSEMKELQKMNTRGEMSAEVGEETENLFESIAFRANLEIPEKVKQEIKERVERKVKNIDENLTEEEKQIKIEQEIFVEENNYLKLHNLDGEIKPNAFGLLDIDIFNNKQEKVEEGEEDKNPEENSKQGGVMTFVWRDGKLVEGKAKQRTKSAYSNWYSGHFNPDDLRRQKELIDRQHFGGPLWDGIKPRSVLDDPIRLDELMQPGPEIPENEDPKNEKNWGKHTWEEIDR